MYAACYFSIQNGPSWLCEYGFKTYAEADLHSKSFHTPEKIPGLHATTLTEINPLFPEFVNRRLIKYNFSPEVNIVKNKN